MAAITIEADQLPEDFVKAIERLPENQRKRGIAILLRGGLNALALLGSRGVATILAPSMSGLSPETTEAMLSDLEEELAEFEKMYRLKEADPEIIAALQESIADLDAGKGQDLDEYQAERSAFWAKHGL